MLEVERDANLCGTVCLWGSSSNPDGFLNQCIQRVWQLGELCLLNLCPCLGLELCCRKIPRLHACIDTSLCLQIFLEVSHGRNLIYIQNPKPWETRLLDLQPLKQERTVESSRNVCESQYHICHSSRQVDRKQAIRWPLTSPPAQGVSPAECCRQNIDQKRERGLSLSAGLRADLGEKMDGSQRGQRVEWRGRRVGIIRWSPLRVMKDQKDMIYFSKSEFSNIKGDKRMSQRAAFQQPTPKTEKRRENESFRTD